MQPKKTSIDPDFEGFFRGPAVDIPILSSGEVTEILCFKMWRLERFLENYRLSASQPGKGLGSRRRFSPNDVYRLAIAKWLLEDRFQPKLVAEIVEELADERIIDYDENGESYLSLVLKRDPESKKRTHEFIRSRSGKASATATKDAYYVLDFDPLMTETDQLIKSALQNRTGR